MRAFANAVSACGHAVSGDDAVFQSPCDKHIENPYPAPEPVDEVVVFI